MKKDLEFERQQGGEHWRVWKEERERGNSAIVLQSQE